MSRTTYTTYNSPSLAVEESKKRTSLLKDGSWIKKPEEEDEAIDRDPNFGRSVLGRYKITDTVVSSEPSQSSISTSRTSTSSVGALTKRFTTSQDELDTSTSPVRTSYTRNTYSSVTSPKSTTTTTVTADGKMTETTITTTTQKSNKTDSFTDRVFSDKTKGSLYTSYSPSKKTTLTETTTTSSSLNDAGNKLYDPMKDSKTTASKTQTVTVRSSGDTAEDKLYDTLIPSTIKDESKRIITETVTISSNDPDDLETTTSTRSSTSTAEDELYSTLIPLSISNSSTPTSSSITKRDIYTVSSNRSDSPTFSSTTRTNSYSSYTDPSSRTSTYTISSKNRNDDIMGDTYSRSSVKTIYTTPERPVLEKDLCSYCRKPFIGDAKIILDDMKINCHASCFKCEVCNSTLGHLKAGDSMWIYKHMVHCERCFEVTRDKWRR